MALDEEANLNPTANLTIPLSAVPSSSFVVPTISQSVVDHYVLTDLKERLHDTFKLKDLRQLQYFLGLELARSAKGIFFCPKEITL